MHCGAAVVKAESLVLLSEGTDHNMRCAAVEASLRPLRRDIRRANRLRNGAVGRNPTWSRR